FSKEALPMFKLIKKDIQFEWTKDCQEAFERLKELLTKEPILRHPDFNKPFILSTDGSKLGLGAILAQEDDEGRIGVIAYASKTLVGAQQNHSASELELLAVKWATDQFHVYLLGKPFTIITDHQPLKYQFSTLALNN